MLSFFLEKLFGANCTVIHTKEKERKREKDMPDSLKVRMIKGPAKVIVKGACHVLGSDVSGQIVKVRAGKALPFEPDNRWCRLHVQLGHGARLWWANPKQAGTSMWRSLAEEVSALAAGEKTIAVMLVGDTDTGKSTLATYLANMAITSGLVPSVIDGDIGQGDLAPPTAIGAVVLSKQVVDLRDVNTTTNQFEFVGGISPLGFEGLIARKLRSILDRTSTLANICIVNTDGYVRNGGVQYKAMIAEELQPDAVICLGENIELFDRSQHAVPSWKVLRARPSSQAYKSRFERLNRRLDQFLRYVGDGSTSFIANLSQVKFDYMNKVFSPSDLYPPPLKQLEPENMMGMFVGLGSNGNVVGFGVILNVNPGNSIINIQTNINSFDTIYLSNVRLSSDRIMEIQLT